MGIDLESENRITMITPATTSEAIQLSGQGTPRLLRCRVFENQVPEFRKLDLHTQDVLDKQLAADSVCGYADRVVAFFAGSHRAVPGLDNIFGVHLILEFVVLLKPVQLDNTATEW